MQAAGGRADTSAMAFPGRLNVAGGDTPAPPLTRFQAVNEARMRRLRASLAPLQRDFLQLLPLLFHANLPALPGFVGHDTPRGVVDYRPGELTLSVARRLARTSRLAVPHEPGGDILGLYFMGSTGTIAHSAASDLDVWLCHRTGLAAEARRALRLKADTVARWGRGLGLDVHFFVLEPDGFRAGATLPLSGESSGSSQHHLLLDEFYRSGLVVAGAWPLWFQQGTGEPPSTGPRARVDFGGLSAIPAEEFFGAAVWQLCKSIQSPHKSLLKLLLIEAYAAEYPHIDLLSAEYKRAVCAGEARLERLDPYLLLLDKVERYLTAQGDETRLELLRRSFYLKVNEPLSLPATDLGSGWRRAALRRRVDGWGWGPELVARLDAATRWDVPTVREESRALMAALTASYGRLSQFARDKAAQSRITQRDLNTLGRRLYAAFERKPGKLELLHRGFGARLPEPELTLLALGGADRERAWLLFTGRLDASALGAQSPLRRGRHPVELLAWCHFNGIADRRSAIQLPAPAGDFDAGAARAVMEALELGFPGGQLSTAGVEALARPAELRAATLLANLGASPRERHLLTSSRTDPLSFGGGRENLVLQLDLVLETTWGELHTFHHAGERAVLDALVDHLRWRAGVDTPAARAPSVHCRTPVYGPAIARRLEQLFTHAREVLRESADGPLTRYVLELGAGYGLLALDRDQPVGESLPDHAALLRRLGRPNSSFRQVVFDPLALGDSPLPSLYALNSPGRVQVCLHEQPGAQAVFVLDEHGSLFHQALAPADVASFLTHLRRFLAALSRRRATLQGAAPSVEFYRSNGDGPREFTLQRLPEVEQQDEESYVHLQVMGERDDRGGATFTLYCEQREYSTLEHGEGLFEAVAADILARRASGLRYPVYITDLELSPALTARQCPGGVQTGTLLQYKRRIEQRLSEALARCPRSG